MLNNYKFDERTNVLTQIERKPFVYDENYVHCGYTGRIADGILLKMSALRFNFIADNIDFDFVENRLSILDVGYGDGAFLKYANSCGCDCFGFEIYRDKNLPKDGNYDVITFFDSLEHTDDISVTIDSFAPHKYLVITVPCLPESFSDEWFEQWKHRKPDEHLWHFSPTSLVNFIASKGYELITIGNPEDVIRKGVWGVWNTTTAVFRKM